MIICNSITTLLLCINDGNRKGFAKKWANFDILQFLSIQLIEKRIVYTCICDDNAIRWVQFYAKMQYRYMHHSSVVIHVHFSSKFSSNYTHLYHQLSVENLLYGKIFWVGGWGVHIERIHPQLRRGTEEP